MPLDTLKNYDINALCNCCVIDLKIMVQGINRIIVQHDVDCKQRPLCGCYMTVLIYSDEVTFDGDIEYLHHSNKCFKKKVALLTAE